LGHQITTFFRQQSIFFCQQAITIFISQQAGHIVRPSPE
jgi:hypothetical protein